ncbi:GGDEF domain-containing protein [Planctomicrobium piriforme]|uniref:diguanylate cyclase n=1 Tax=Planctomicrobium piriforme TaxID=1576369 RepID=A0A1I3QQZ9_9PLAN|nr:GGDEF domain-containing protein [Planctomicrobium piriforme]SFJ36220.1 diguanylate cyclase (GGDEF) domain-containing protein [Planctomicrobium piriforme]
MSNIAVNTGMLVCAGLVVANVLQLWLWQRAAQRRMQQWDEFRRKDTVQRTSLLELSRTVAARRFEIDWLLCCVHRTDAFDRAALLIRQSVETATPVCCLAVSPAGQILKSAPASLMGAVHLTSAGKQKLNSHAPVELSLQHRDYVISGTQTAVFESCSAFPCEAAGAHCGWLLVSRVPNLTADSAADQSLIAKLCGSLALPTESDAGNSVDRAGFEEIRLVRDMLQLRTLTDEEFTTPEEMLQEFLARLAVMTGFERATLYAANENDAATHPSIERWTWGGRSIPATLAPAWDENELRLLTQFRHTAQRPLWLDHTILQGAETQVFQTALLIRVSETNFPDGLLLLVSREELPRRSATEELVDWSAQFLPNSFDKALARQQVEERARRDGLTQLANRQTFDSEIQKQLHACSLLKTTCSLLLIDVDHFKRINDNYGHLAGDDVLRTTATLISQAMQQQRVTDRPLVARYGGEEFAVLLPDCPTVGARRIAEQLRSEIESTLFHVDGSTLQLTISIGVAETTHTTSTAVELIRAADEALYAAKHEGRNRVVVAAAKQNIRPAV